MEYLIYINKVGYEYCNRRMMRRLSKILILCLFLSACMNTGGTDPSDSKERAEDLDAKAMLQGIWIESETDEVSFWAEGDSIYYPDSTSPPAYFYIVNDSFCLGDNRYAIVKQTEHLFCFQNQVGEEMRFEKSEVAEDSLAFADRQPEILSLTEVMKIDSVVIYEGERYHWYIAVNPTKYRVTKMTYNSEGVGVENVYYDNIIHISLFKGSTRLFSRDFKKQMYGDNVPSEFLEQAVLGNMQYDHVDAKGLHFNATLCVPDGASCYLVETLIGFNGQMSMTLLEY